MIHRADLWGRFADLHYWWMHAMLCLWLVFALMLYIVEPLFLHRRMKRPANPARNFARMEWMHRLLFALALVTIFGAVAGSHGLRSEEHTSELQSLMRISYAVFCLKKKKQLKQ